MKKILVAAATLALVGVGLVSCKKSPCFECTVSGATSRVCEDGFNAADHGGLSWTAWSDSAAADPNCKKRSELIF